MIVIRMCKSCHHLPSTVAAFLGRSQDKRITASASAAPAIQCNDDFVEVSAATVEELAPDTTAIAASGIVGSSGPVECTGQISTPSLGSAADETEVNLVICSLTETTDVGCSLAVRVAPHPLLDCPAPPAGELRAATAVEMTAPFGSGAVTCDPASPAAIAVEEFPGRLEEDTTLRVTCSSSETPNTCSLDVTLAARTPLSSAVPDCFRLNSGPVRPTHCSQLLSLPCGLFLLGHWPLWTLGFRAAHVLDCAPTARTEAAVVEDLSGNARAITTEVGAITANSGPFDCSGSINVPPLSSEMDLTSTIRCWLFEDEATTCEFTLFVGPHPLLDCPVPPANPFREAEATSTPFASLPVTCDPPTPADIPFEAFPLFREQDKPFTVTCSSSETPNTCTFDVALRARAPLPCACRYVQVAGCPRPGASSALSTSSTVPSHLPYPLHVHTLAHSPQSGPVNVNATRPQYVLQRHIVSESLSLASIGSDRRYQL